MISVLIPVKNNNALELVTELHRQLENIAIPSEIIIYNDVSDASFSEWFNEARKLPLVKILNGEVQKGAMGARIELANAAKYNYLLYLDSDNKIINDKFIQNYLQHSKAQWDVLLGGTLFPETETDCSLMLSWKYRTQRETKKGLLITRNLMIKKTTFLSVSFPEELLQQYGHDDTWLGIQLHKKRAVIKTINNPVYNYGLENFENFIAKAKEAMNNLFLMKNFEAVANISSQVKLFRAANIFKQTGLNVFFQLYYKLFRKKIEKNLASCNPSLKYFDYYRLNYFLSLKAGKP